MKPHRYGICLISRDPALRADVSAVLDRLPRFGGPKVIYAAASRLGNCAGREGITFKQTPYALEV